MPDPSVKVLDYHALQPVNGPVLVVAMTARTGSTQLCSVLNQLGSFGDPREIFNPRGAMPHLLKRFQRAGWPRYLVELARGAEVFCFKVAGCDWQPVCHHAVRLFPMARYVYLHRRDADAQALSLARARMTGVWHVRSGDDPPEDRDVNPPAELVSDCRRQIREEVEGWGRFFDQHRISPLSISYEEFAADPDSTVRRVCRYASVELSDRSIPSGMYRKLG